MVLMALVIGSVAVPGNASAATYYAPYNASTFYGTSQGGTGCGGNDIFQYPYASARTGEVKMDTGSWGLGCGAYRIDAWAGFFGPYFTPTTSGSRTIVYKWRIWWDATVATSLCFLGASWAEGYMKFCGNVYDVNAAAWKLNGNAVAKVWENNFGCGLSWSGWQDGADYYVSFSVYLEAGRTYGFYTYMMTHSLAGAAGFATANARNNVGTNGDVAYLMYMYVSG
jgi:hypothetical protein